MTDPLLSGPRAPDRPDDRLFRALIEHASDVIVVLEAQGAIRYVSPSVQRVLGHPPESLVGQAFLNLLHPDDRPAASATIREQIRDPDARQTVRYRVRHADGSWRTLEGTGSNHLDDAPVRGVVVNLRDVTTREVTERALRESNETLRALLAAAPAAVIALDDRGRVTLWNPAAERIFGWSEAEVLGKPLPTLPEGGREEHERLRAMVLGGQAFSDREVVRLRRDGTLVPVRLSTAPVSDEQGRVVGAVSLSVDISEQRRAESLTRQLAAIVQTSSDAIISHSLEDGAILSWNPGAEHVFGYAAEDVLGRPVSILAPAELELEEQQIWARLARGEFVRHYETLRCRKDGRLIDVSLSAAPIPDAAGGIRAASLIARDITEQRAAEQALAESRAELRALVSAMSDVILVVDRSGRFVDIPSTSAPMPHRPPQELIGRTFHEVYPAAQADLFLAAVHRALATGEPIRMEYSLLVDGRELWFSASVSRMSVSRVVWVARDITELKEGERELRAAKEAAEAASRAKSEFLSSMSHELRTPLNSVIGFASVLRKNRLGGLLPEELVYLDRILANGRHLLGLINDLLDLSRIEAGKMEVERTPLDLSTLVEETVAELRPQARPGVRLTTAIPAALAPIETDARRFKQLLINLVGNALKFTEQGEVRVGVEVDGPTGRPLRVDVTDTGIGIAADRLAAIFEAFEQGETGTARRYGGTGLGLTISASLARLLGYRIDVRSEPGRGSTFSLRLAPGPTDPAAG